MRVAKLLAALSWPFRNPTPKSERTHAASERFFKSLREAEEDFGAQFANEIALAHIDAGERFKRRAPSDLVGQGEYLMTMPTATSIQNQI